MVIEWNFWVNATLKKNLIFIYGFFHAISNSKEEEMANSHEYEQAQLKYIQDLWKDLLLCMCVS